MITCHYYASRKEKFVVFGVNGITTIDSERVEVKGKADARKLSKQRGAVDWNY